jgi:hypothetical protein
VIERFYRWRRNPLAAKPSYPKPSNLPIPISPHALYTKYPGLSNLYSLKKCPENITKSYKTPGKNLKRFDNYGNNLYKSGIYFPAP